VPAGCGACSFQTRVAGVLWALDIEKKRHLSIDLITQWKQTDINAEEYVRFGF
jgi:hypothetical protein